MAPTKVCGLNTVNRGFEYVKNFNVMNKRTKLYKLCGKFLMNHCHGNQTAKWLPSLTHIFYFIDKWRMG